MAHIVLVHGAWHGGWCWQKLVPALGALGHSVNAIDLPGHGDDPLPPAQVTVDAYVARVGEALNTGGEATYLLGHSMGGFVITETAARFSEQVAGLIYLAAMLSPPGVNSGGLDPESLLLAALAVDESTLTMTVQTEHLKEIFYQDCSDADIALAKARLVPQKVLGEPPPASDTQVQQWANIPRYYITCTQDKALPYSQQKRMIEQVGCERVIDMEASHSPFFSKPQALAKGIDSLV
ncbi:MAG: alpha/beta fold hydrolase [Pseudomonadota bacterium]